MCACFLQHRIYRKVFILWPCERAKWGLAAAKTMIINL